MKNIKKFSGVFFAIALVALMIATLVANKQQQEDELQQMLSFSYAVPVQTTLADYRAIGSEMSEMGITNSDKQIEVLSETQGKLMYLKAKVGESVRRKEVIARVESSVLQSQVDLAKSNLQKVSKDLERFERLYQEKAVTQQQLEEIRLRYTSAKINLEAYQEQLSQTEILAPMDGTISARHVEAGSVIAPGMPVVTISGSNDMNFILHVTEQQIQKIHKGLAANVYLDVFPAHVYEATVSEIAVKPDLSGRYEVRLLIANSSSSVLTGMNGTAKFFFPSPQKEIVLPRKAIEGSIRNASVFLVQGDSVVSRQVQAQALNQREVIIQHGLIAGQEIVLTGQINLENGTKVNVINK